MVNQWDRWQGLFVTVSLELFIEDEYMRYPFVYVKSWWAILEHERPSTIVSYVDILNSALW